MKIHAVIDTKTLELLLVTDDVEEAYKEVERLKCRRSDGETRYAILDSDSVRLSPSAMTCISMEYDMEQLAEKVRARLNARNLQENSFGQTAEQTVSEITSEAYYLIACCDADKGAAIDIAINVYLKTRKAKSAAEIN